MKYKYIFFDLDGTIIDSSPGVLNCAKRAIKTYGFKEFSEEILKNILIGPPLYEGLKKLLNIKDEKILKKLVKEFRECYQKKGVYENKLYDGIEEVLEILSKRSELYILTSKPTQFAKEILKQHKIQHYFKIIDGAQKDDKVSKKAEKLFGYTQKKKESLMIGDRVEDINAAQQSGIDSLAIGYGFDEEKLLLQNNPTYFVKNPQEILLKVLDER